MTKVLLITPNCEDYLSDALLHGFRSLLKDNLIDYPKQEIMYSNCNKIMTEKVRGNGFTLYSGLLDDILIDRLVEGKVQTQKFDLIIIGDIWRCFGQFVQLLPYLNFQNTIILDGADTPQPYPFAGYWWRKPYWWFLPKAHTRFLYFKREWTSETIRNLYYQILPLSICQFIPVPKNFRSIAFSIPEEKIISDLPSNLANKRKLFPKHIVDAEVAANVDGSLTSYAFEDEQEYYQDIQISKFGITTKRAGWDCLRHYEIAANGAVPCFRDLDLKPKTCAPHGLNSKNCISYNSYSDLINKIEKLSDREYESLQIEALSWVRENTTIARARQVLSEFNRSTGKDLSYFA
jgi:hypothetical protein